MNGLENLQLLSTNEVKRREPLIKSRGGLWIPSSGIINSHALMEKLEYLINANNSTLVYNTEVVDIDHIEGDYLISFKDLEYYAKSSIVINAAGLWSDQISRMVGIDNYKIQFCKGEYYKTSKYRNKIQSLIYPMPTEISLGIHIVLHLDGSLGFGPNAYYIDQIDYSMNDNNKKTFLKNINSYLDLDESELVEDFSGIRPKIQKRGEPAHDFIISNEKALGYDNFINLIGIESPGLTSSLAIAKYINNIIAI